jgi:cytochrome d ubiquinol oxidase subunit II
MTVLQVTWFVLVIFFFTVYALLDGFDLGVGILFFMGRKKHRRALLSAIGPFWDGNEVWLLAAGASLFAAFPKAYASMLSGFYLPLILVIASLIFRAAALEFRNALDSPRWQHGWDRAFAAGSILPAILFGVALGNIVQGIPLDEKGNFTGSPVTLLNPYALVTGVMACFLFAQHGALFIAFRSKGELAESARPWAQNAWAGSFVFILSVCGWSTVYQDITGNYRAYPVLMVVLFLLGFFIAAVPVYLNKDQFFRAFMMSSGMLCTLAFSYGAAIFPCVVPARDNPFNSLCIAAASSTEKTLFIMLIMALMGIPLVTWYTVYAYRVFLASKHGSENDGY